MEDITTDIKGEPEVFETPDVTIPEYRPHRIYEEKHHADIDRNNISIAKNAMKFKQKIGDANIKKKNLQNHKNLLFQTYTTKLINSDQEEFDLDASLSNEDLNSRLERLNYEIEELEMDLKKDNLEFNDEDLSVIDLINKANHIQYKMDLFNYRINNSGAATYSKTLEGERLLEKINSLYIDDSNDNSESKNLYAEKVKQTLDLEARITSLEELLGPETLSKAELPGQSGIRNTLQILLEYVEKLRDFDYLASINRRVKELIGELDRLINLRERLRFYDKDKVMFHRDAEIDLETKTKIDQLFSLKEQFDLYLAIAPGFVERFKVLGNLHQEFIELGPTLKKMKEDIVKIDNINHEINELYSNTFDKLKNLQFSSKDTFLTLDSKVMDLSKQVDGIL